MGRIGLEKMALHWAESHFKAQQVNVAESSAKLEKQAGWGFSRKQNDTKASIFGTKCKRAAYSDGNLFTCCVEKMIDLKKFPFVGII